MKRGKYEKAETRYFSILLVIFCIIGVVLITTLLHSCNAGGSGKTESTSGKSIVKNPDSIAIPGYEMLELKANSREQTVCLPNPPQNDCYFQITLYLENGTLLWQSELVKPGETSKPMVLSEVLEKGTYSNAVLRYSCYRMDETLSPLNGAETKVTLWVK